MNASLAVELLEQCEAGLRKLAAEALVAGDDNDADQIADWARGVKAMIAQGQRVNGETPVSMRDPEHNGRATLPNVAGRGTRARPAADQYPKFFRKGDELVKVGWSKTDHDEYHHRAPRRSLNALMTILKEVGARGRLFSSDDFLPLKDPANNTEFPPYQAYVGMAWLKHLGLISQHGRRGGYSLAAGKHLDSAIASVWPELAEWRG
jgi:hypothetical protein